MTYNRNRRANAGARLVSVSLRRGRRERTAAAYRSIASAVETAVAYHVASCRTCGLAEHIHDGAELHRFTPSHIPAGGNPA